MAAEAGQRLHTPSAPVDKTNATTTTSTNVTSDGNKVEPGQVGGNGTTSRGRAAGAVKSVSDRISSAVSKTIDGLKGGGAKTGKASTGDTSTGDTSKEGPH